MQDHEFYRQILGLQVPWHVSGVQLTLAEGKVVVTLGIDQGAAFTCPECGEACPRYDTRQKRWRHLDTCQFETILEGDIPRVECPEHGVRMVKVPWAEPGSKFTALFEAAVIFWLQAATRKDVAEQMRLSWGQVDKVMERAVARGLERRRQLPVAQIGVDETSFRKRHDYVTVVVDQASGDVLHVADDRKAESLGAYFDSVEPLFLGAIETIAMDMHAPYIKAVKDRFEDADERIAFDRFHVAKHLGDAVNKVRRKENKELLFDGRRQLVGTRFLWLKGPDGLSDEDQDRIERAVRRGILKTARAWAIKEAAGEIWHYRSLTWARKAWQRWLGWAMRSRLEPIKKAARTIRNHLQGILVAVTKGVTNALSESRNAGIQKLKRMACGFRNKEKFRTAIYFHFGGLDLMPEGVSTHTK